MMQTEAIAQRLIDELQRHPRVVVAFSGGVDSAVVAAAAQRALGDKALAVMAISPSVPERQSELAAQVAAEIGINLQTISTHETERPDYQRNDGQRCFYCKQTLYQTLATIADEHRDSVICSGTNADDLGDHRPGIQAGRDAAVQTPLADLGITKTMVRQLAKHWELSVWDLPAGPCLASRIAYGEPVTVDKLQRIDRAENWLRDEGFAELRVRLHPGQLARIEVPAARIAELVQPEFRQRMSRHFRSLGFQFITVDIEGLRSGNLNQLVSIGN
ncbi:ATP-dependent sacrificial sulfur transferase LarE [Rosistilla oblonga]|uniref:ATP-dependent sacrificial sulfur transferase LarE n=1 Tax=Rosistilla oblonga TaxID=2527990 RepID=UPI003A9716B3